MIETRKEKHFQIIEYKLKELMDIECGMWVLKELMFEKGLGKLLNRIKCIKISTLVISQIRDRPILKHIQNIGFPALTILNLSNSFIASIEGIHWMEVPMLCHLILDFNPITKIDSLRKVFLYDVTHISLCGNPITTISRLREYFSPVLSHLNLKSCPQLNNLDVFLLLQFPLSILNLQNSPSFLNQKLSNHIEGKKKFPTMRRLKV